MDTIPAVPSRRPPFEIPFSALSQFPLEWLGLAMICLIDATWAADSGFSVTVSAAAVAIIAAVMAGGIFFHCWYVEPRASLTLEYFALTFVLTASFAVLSYLSWTLRLPLADAAFLRFDRKLGFDWLYWFSAVKRHPLLLVAFEFSYNTLIYQGVYFATLFAVLRNRERLREVFWIVFVACALTTLLSAIFPAYGTFDAFRLGDIDGYLGDMKRLREGTDLHFQLSQLTGVISFPSFHTVMALVYIYAFRGTGLIGGFIAVLNLVMLPSIPFLGGHYLVDILAGAAVALASILLVRAVLARVELSAPVLAQAAPG
jgi:hypothetical protein